jgi:hypothetical protein
MTDKPDTTREAVNKVLAELTGFTACDPYCHGRCSVCPDDAVSRAATTVRALRAEVAALREAVERARGEALEEAAGVALAYSQKRRRDAAKVKSGAVLPKRQSSSMHGAAADAAYYLHQAIRASAALKKTEETFECLIPCNN